HPDALRHDAGPEGYAAGVHGSTRADDDEGVPDQSGRSAGVLARGRLVRREEGRARVSSGSVTKAQSAAATARETPPRTTAVSRLSPPTRRTTALSSVRMVSMTLPKTSAARISGMTMKKLKMPM